jgi:beta-glucosidase
MNATDLPNGFPQGFVWGAATSSFQIEGDRAGRGDTVWDVFCRVPGAVRDGHHGDVACDHLALVDDDVALMASLGLHAYRFSFAWARVLPDASGAASQPGLDQYRRLVDTLLVHGIEPVPTLFHWDLPMWLEDRGGWRSRDTVERFAEYAAVLVDTFGDRITRWATLNEPWCYAYLGHASGDHAPGRQDPAEAVAVAHHQLLGHAAAIEAMRDRAGRELSLGCVVNPAPVLGDDRLGADGVRRIDGTLNRWFLDALLLGRYPDDVLDDLGPLAACVLDGDAARVGRPGGRPIDWLGINYYNDQLMTAAAPDDPVPPRPSPHVTAPHARPVAPALMREERTDLDWPITPWGFESFLVRLRDDYGDALPPVFITENGAAYDDPVTTDADGTRRCDDPRRIAYLDAHLRAVSRAIAAGVPVRGYFEWSLLDNFEWAHGYHQRFGIVHVDVDTQVRTPKASAHWYADVIARNGR